MSLPIVKYGDPVLETVAEAIEEITPDLHELAREMFDTMYENDGVGLAANQVGVLKRLVVIDTSMGENPQDMHILINPVVLETSGEERCEEGCLSFPGVSFELTRPAYAKVRAQDLTGQERIIEGTGLLARALLHEIDHLNGIVFINHLHGLKKEMVKTKIKKMKKDGDWD